MTDFPPPGGASGPPPPGQGGGPAPGWWQASDGNWYPPDQQPGYGVGTAAGYGYGYGYPPQVAKSTNGFAIASLIVSLVSCGLGSILGVIFGHVALSQIKRNDEGGRGLAIAGLVIGYLGLIILVAFILLVIVAGESDNEFRFDEGDFGMVWR